jgi:hypothetical protein
MKTNMDTTDNGLNRLLNQLAAQKKKGVVAAALIVLMVFMWFRLLTDKGPQQVQAAVTGNSLNEAVQKLKVKFIKLPFIQGRHDVLARDFFKMDSRFFGRADTSIVSTDTAVDGVGEVVQGLRLDAISTGAQPEAFINDRLVKVGDTVLVEGSKTYECEIVSIKVNSVLVKYGDAEIELKLKQPDTATPD